MNETNDWFQDIGGKISSIKQKMNNVDNKKYKVALLQTVTHKVNNYSDCSTCHNIQKEISVLVNELDDLSNMTKDKYDKYLVNVDNVIKHLKESHRIVLVRQYAGFLTALPLIIGILLTIVGISMQSWFFMRIGLFGGVAGTIIGFIVGRVLDNRAEKQGRTI